MEQICLKWGARSETQLIRSSTVLYLTIIVISVRKSAYYEKIRRYNENLCQFSALLALRAALLFCSDLSSMFAAGEPARLSSLN